jgi:hypothetical protein
MRDRFWNIITGELAGTRLGVADLCEDLLDNQIEMIVSKVRADGWKRPQTEVEDDFRRLVRNMIDLAKRRGYGELHEDTYRDGLPAAGIFCPGFWPFC